ncbi:hypothetical protein AAG906_024142 [Vitis piasezkii]
MFPPAEDPLDLGIPPNRGPLPVRTNPNSEPNTRVRSGHRRNARPQGIRGARAHRIVLMIMQNKIGVTEQEWSFLDGIKSGTSLKFG